MRMGREPPEEVGIHVIEMDSHCCVEGKGQDSPGDKVKIKLLGERRTIFVYTRGQVRRTSVSWPCAWCPDRQDEEG